MSESAAVWFRRARLRAGYRSQGELARVLGLARAAVGNWESETVGGRPSRAILPHLAHLLGVPADELAARFGIDLMIASLETTSPDADLRAFIEEALDGRRADERDHNETAVGAGHGAKPEPEAD